MPIERFEIKVTQEALDDLKYRLAHVRWPENLTPVDWERGTDQAWLQSLVSYWREHFDWRAQEAKLNQFSQFRTNIDGTRVHFIHEYGKGPRPLPIILTHGWPDSYMRYLKLIPLLTDPANHGGSPEDAFDVIIPSLPGFGFSDMPDHGGVNNFIISELWAKLMTEVLGYARFVGAGGDIGSGVTRYLAASHPELLYGIHLTDVGIVRDLLQVKDVNHLTAEELEYRQSSQNWMANEGAYMSIQSTKPNTLAYGLADSPVGLAAWILEKFRTWSDCNGDPLNKFSKDELLTNIMIYWVTNSIATSTAIYYENTHSLPPIGNISVPTRLALFAADIMQPPIKWVEQNFNIASITTIPRGGHFTAMEEPELMAEDIRAFCRPFRKANTA
ncbi:epoxide hydrolase family protein [Paenibacillus sanguinis]|uniref:epoxide hydrolase family protein n=1 Tax=Paenibacillus sanguinis TaxID=225906 RepID=UPI0003608C7D|nr:epoxide hydrolase family protein [Paenibacillus sanguinis]